jgi:hypothetical protein
MLWLLLDWVRRSGVKEILSSLEAGGARSEEEIKSKRAGEQAQAAG